MKALLLFLPMFAFASMATGAEPDYDIVARTINFVIFAAILYYFIANPIKNAYKSRIEGIEKSLTRSREKIQAAKAKEEQARAKVAAAREAADDLLKTSKIEAEQLAAKIEKDTAVALNFLSENNEEQKEFARRASLRKTVGSVLEEAFDDSSIKIDEKGLVDLIIKKVS